MKYYLNIGSNLGDRHRNISQAIKMLGETFCASCRCSEVVESAPWGYASPNKFLNIGVEIESALLPEQFLTKTMAVEKSISTASHRSVSGDYIDRIVDIDIIAVDSLVIHTGILTVPHPRMHLRRFVLQPMVELNPDWIHPLLHLSAEQLLRNIEE